jgi:hypothetical protein
LDWKTTLNIELQKLNGSILYGRFRAILPVFSKIGMFVHIREFNDNNLQLYVDILRYLGGHEHESAYGLGLASMVQTNLPGNILRIEGRMKALEDLVSGRQIFSFAVSEKGWRGRLSNTKTNLSLNSENKFILSGEKGFATNGRQADVYLVVARTFDPEEYKIIFLPRNTAGLEIEPFDLDESKEATHAIIRFKDIAIPKDNILNLNYKEHARYLPYWERFCFHLLLSGLAIRILSEDKHPDLSSHRQELTSELGSMDEKISQKLKMVVSSGIHILKLKDSIIGQEFINKLLQLEGISSIYPELKLFERLILQK